MRSSSVTLLCVPSRPRTTHPKTKAQQEYGQYQKTSKPIGRRRQESIPWCFMSPRKSVSLKLGQSRHSYLEAFLISATRV